MKKVIAVAGAVLIVTGALVLLLSAGVVSMIGGVSADLTMGAGQAPARTSASPGRGGRIPSGMLSLYRGAAATCPGLDWRVLAAIGTVESANGTSTLPGVHSGANSAGAEGPMQFEPATFSAFAEPVPPGGADPPSPYDATDAVYAAARMLCTDGAADPVRVAGAVYAYNHSDAYVRDVLALAESMGPPVAASMVNWSSEAASPGAVAAGYALAQVGTPYRWGAEKEGVGFDCSGLAQAAWRAAGVALPRLAQAQHDSGTPVPDGGGLATGDLVFFGSGPDRVTHVGIVVAAGTMVDAPHSGSAVRVESFAASIGSAWGDEQFLGAVRPGS